MNTPIIRKINLSGAFQPLAAERTVGTFTIRNPSADNAVLLCDDGVTELPMDRSQQFTLEGVDPRDVSLGLRFDPGRGKANLYLNGYLLGRYWPERGPQRTFSLPWGVLHPDRENHLAIAVWKRAERAALGKVRLAVLD